jgi:DNA polymerase-3 subunit delta
MLIFLYGEDSFRSKRKLQEIIEEYKKVHKNGLNLTIIDCQSADFEDFKREIETVSMFKEKKLIILKNAFSAVEFEKSLLDCKNNLLKDKENIIVFFEDGKADSRKSFFKFLEKNSKSQEFKSLSALQLLAFAKKEFEKYGVKIQNEALGQLVIFCGSDLWRLFNEIKKLAAFKVKDKIREVNLKDVELMVNSEIETDIFKTIDAIARKNKKQALGLLYSHLEDGDSVPYLLSMINFQFRNLLLIKDLLEKRTQYHLIAQKSGIHPFVVRKSYELCEKFTLPEIKKIYQKIFEADINIKTGKIEPQTALDLLIAGI